MTITGINTQCPRCKLWGPPIREGHAACRDCEIAQEQDESIGMTEQEFKGLFGKVDEFLAELVLGPDAIAVPEETTVGNLIRIVEKRFTKATVDRMRNMRWK